MKTNLSTPIAIVVFLFIATTAFCRAPQAGHIFEAGEETTYVSDGGEFKPKPPFETKYADIKPSNQNPVQRNSIVILSNGKAGGASPNQSDNQVLRYDNGVNNTAIGSGEGIVYAAAYFPASTMALYTGLALTHVEVYIYYEPVEAEIIIYGPGTSTAPGNPLLTQTFNTTANSWVMTELDAPFAITGEDLWICYRVEHEPGYFSTGIDSGPVVAGYGDMVSEDGIIWFSLFNDLGFDNNINIAGYLSEGSMPVVNAGNDLTACENEPAQLNDASAENYTTLLWTTEGDGTIDNENELNPNYYFGADDLTNGIVSLCLTAYPEPGSGFDPETDCLEITIQPLPVVNIYPDTIRVCQGDQVDFTGLIQAQNWSSAFWFVMEGDGVFVDNTLLETTYFPSELDFLFGCIQLGVLVEPILPCTESAYDFVTVCFQTPPTSFAGNDTTICEDETFEITEAAATDYVLLQWTHNGSGTFNNETILNPVYTPGFTDIIFGSVELCLSASPVNPCSVGVSDCMTLSFQQNPEADAGDDGTLCCQSYAPNGAALNNSSIQWSTNGDGSFSDPAIPNPTYYPGVQDRINESAELCLTAFPLSPCQIAATDCMTLTITPYPVAIAGADTGICGCEPFTISQAVAENYIGLQWTITGGTGYLDFYDIINPTYYPSPEDCDQGTIELCLHVFGPDPCMPVSDCMTLSYGQPPSADAGGDETICVGDEMDFAGRVSVSNYASLLWITSGMGTFYPSDEVAEPVYIPSPYDYDLGCIQLSLLATPIDPCEQIGISDMQLCFQQQPTVDAGEDKTIGCSEFIALLDALASNYSALQWTTSGDGVFDDETIQNPVYTPGVNDCESCEVELCLTAYPIDPCTVSVTDCLTLFVMIIPEAEQPLGQGTSADPYLIANLQNLYWISEQASNGETFAGVYFKQTADIDASETEDWFCGLGWLPIGGNFYGNYNGDCHVIESLYINRPDEDYTGLFGTVRNGAKVEKLRLVDFNITGHSYVGALAGRVRSNAEVEYVDVENGQIHLFDLYGGGLTGLNYHSSRIYRCSASGQVTRGDENSYNYVGGFVGGVGESAIVEECFSTAIVTSLNHRSIGGFAGLVSTGGEVRNSYARGPVTASGQRVGGFCGELGSGTITNCFSTGLVYSPFSYVGGFVGRLGSGACNNNFWDIETSGQSTSPCATGKTTAEMKTLATFTDAGWDFENVWAMDGFTNDGYPALKWQLAPVVVAGDDATITTGNSYYLNGVAENYSALIWTTSGDGTFSNPEILNPEYSLGELDLINGEVEFCLTAYPLDPCLESVTDCMTLTIEEEIFVYAGPDDTICVETTKNGNEDCYLLNPEITGNYSSLLWTTSGDGTFDDETMEHACYFYGPDDLDNGIVILTLGVTDKSAKSNTSDSMTLTFQPAPTADAGIDETICCSDVFPLNGDVQNTSSFYWTSSGDGDFDDEFTIYTPGPFDCDNGTAELCLNAQPIDPCTVEATDCMTLYLQPNPIADAGADATITEGETYLLSGSAMHYANFEWSSSGNGDFDPPNVLTPVYTPSPQDILAGVAELCLTAYPLSPCFLYSEDCMILTINLLPIVYAGQDDSVCCDEPYELLNADASNYSSLIWTSSGDGNFVPDDIENPTYFPGPEDCIEGFAELCITALPLPPSTVSVMDCMILTFFPLPEVNCPNDFSVCISDPAFALSGATPIGGEYSGPGITDGFFDPLETGEGLHTVTYSYIDENGCENSCQFTITVEEEADGSAGPDWSVCEGDVFEILLAEAFYYGAIQWETSGSGFFDDPNQINPVYTPGSSDKMLNSVELCLNLSPLEPCTVEFSDCMTLSFQPAPTVFAGDDATICEGDTYLLDGAVALDYQNILWITDGVGTFSGENEMNPIYYPGFTDYLTGQVILYLNAGPISPCATGDYDEMILHFQPSPIANAGNDATICTNASYLLADAYAEHYDHLLWITDGFGTFSDETVINPTYYPNFTDYLTGYVTLYLNAAPIDPCSNGYSDEMMLTFESQQQDVQIDPGWTGISTHLSLNDNDMSSILEPVVDDMVILYNYSGIFYPAGGIFNITQWDTYVGYIGKFSNANTISFTGCDPENRTVYLNQGWNIIPVLRDEPQTIEALFAGNTKLQIVKEVAGTGIYWPAFGINTIGNVLPGKAYFVSVSDTTSIDYSNLAKESSDIIPPNLSEINTPWNTVIQNPISHIVVFELTDKALQDKDIIGGFTTEGVCAGLTKIQNSSSPFAISLHASDQYLAEKTGFETDEHIRWKLFKPHTGEIFDVAVGYTQEYDNSGLFVPNGLSVVNHTNLIPSATGNVADDHIKIYPNPNDGTFTIEGDPVNASIVIYNISGAEIYHNISNLPFEIDILNQPKGLYYIKIIAERKIYFEKLVKN